MKLNDAQRAQVRHWLNEGIKLSDVQRRIENEMGLRLTYMEVRLLVDDLRVIPKDPEVSKKVETPLPGPVEPAKPPEPDSRVKLTVDTVMRPGSLVSGRVTFGDGQAASWMIDQTGRPGLVPDKKGYRPPPADMQDFQMLLEQELLKLGY